VVLGLLVKVYWRGYGAWPVTDYAPWAQIPPWREPLLLYGGAVGYLVGWVLSRVEDSPQSPQSSQRKAEMFFSVVSVRSVVSFFIAAGEEGGC
jgi:hypothetical protein